MSENERQAGKVVLMRKWHSCAEVAEMRLAAVSTVAARGLA